MRYVPQRWLVLLIFLVLRDMTAGANTPSTNGLSGYFENVSSVTSAPASFFIRIASVKKGLPAHRAGLRAGDRIVGIDGLRVRNIKEYNLVRLFYDQPPAVGLTVVRKGEILNISIPDPKPIRSGGFQLTGEEPNFLSVLRSSGLLTDDLFPEILPRVRIAGTNGITATAATAGTNDLIAACVKAFEVPVIPEAPNFFYDTSSDAAVALASFPARGQEEIIALLAANVPADREWVAGILKVYALLLFEKHDAAIRIMAEAKLLDHQPKLFLGSLLQFYKRVAERRILPGEDIPLGAYQVDIPFFALCFPYPITPNSRPYVFPADPKFQVLFSKAFSGSRTRGQFQEELTKEADQYVGPGKAIVDGYIDVVKASILDFYRHGGWPYRGDAIYSDSKSATMIVELKRRLEANPDERTEIALSLVVPSIYVGDEATFRQACDLALEAGPTVSALVNRIIEGTLSFRRDPPPGRWRAIMMAADNALPKPAVYTFLQRTSPGFVRRCSAGRWQVDGPHNGDIVGLSSFCFTRPFVVAKALASPLDVGRFPDPVGVPAQAMNPAEIDTTAAQWTQILAHNPDPGYMNMFFTLYPRLGAGKAFDVIRQAMAYHEDIWQCDGLSDGPSTQNLYREFFGDVEGRYYREIVAALDKLDGRDPDLPKKIADLYAKAGVPSVCLLLSKKLKDAGHADLAKSYQQRAADFWDAVILQVPSDISSHAWASRDLASTPGFEDLFDNYARPIERQGGGGMLQAILHVYRAIVESHGGRYDATVEHLIRSNDRELQNARVVTLYNGTTYSSFSLLRTQFLTDLLKERRLSEEQISRLRAVRELNVDAIIKAKIGDNDGEDEEGEDADAEFDGFMIE